MRFRISEVGYPCRGGDALPLTLGGLGWRVSGVRCRVWGCEAVQGCARVCEACGRKTAADASDLALSAWVQLELPFGLARGVWGVEFAI